MWLSDLFMRRVDAGETWSLFCPNEAPGLADVHGAEYDRLYTDYEARGIFKRQVPARTVWEAIVNAQIETGQPYMLYKDSINAKSNQANLGTIKSSNLCVVGDTLVLTERGQRPIKDLVHVDDVRVWNGEEFAPVDVTKTGEGQDTVAVEISSGLRLQCTPYHKFYLEGRAKPVQACELRSGDVLITQSFPTLDAGKPLRNAYDEGWNANEGTYAKPPRKGTYVVPTGLSLAARLNWFDGLLDASGIVPRTETATEIHVYSRNLDFLRRTACLLHTLGVGSLVSTHGGTARLVVPCGDVEQLLELGLAPKRLRVYTNRVKDAEELGLDLSRRPTVTSVRKVDGGHDTYCFQEPLRHMGIFNGILCGNCTEIVEFSSRDQISVCNLSSVALPKFVRGGRIDYEALHDVVKTITRSTNEVIDRTFYPIEEARNSNLAHRPIGLGVQGFADVLCMLKLPWDSPEAAKINVEIFATLYHAAVEASVDMADEQGPYSSFQGSPASQGKLQFDLWEVEPVAMYDWEALRQRVKRVGMRNSLLVAPMPTASTAQIMANTEAFEPVQAMIFKRTTMTGEFVVVNKHLVKELVSRGLWSRQLKDRIIAASGSIQNIPNIDEDLKAIYKTAWEIKQRTLIDLAAARGPYIDQSQSLNLFVAQANSVTLRNMHFYAWRKGLKTGELGHEDLSSPVALSTFYLLCRTGAGMYYCRSRPATNAIKFTIDPSLEKEHTANSALGHTDEPCLTCSS